MNGVFLGIDGRANSDLYGYVPTEWTCGLFIALFGLSTFIHLGQAFYYQLWFLLLTVGLAGIGEVIGWRRRLWSSKNPNFLDPYLMQITTTIIAPTPLVAANFVILGQLIGRLGPKYSRLSPRWYTSYLLHADMCQDIVALVVQAVGAAKASTAVENNEDPGPGGNIMLAGIAFQLLTITIYLALACEFVTRFLKGRPLHDEGEGTIEGFNIKTKLMLFGLLFSSTVIFIRSVYRLIELSDGWSGRIISIQVYFNVLDGAMITLAFYCLNIFHPGLLIGSGKYWKHPQNIADTIPVEVGDKKKSSTDSQSLAAC